QAEDGIRDRNVTGVQTCALPISQVQYMKSLSANMYNAFSRMPLQMSSIVVNAMSGLISGLWGGKARVMATARNIANSVASTMKSGLRIHSPSRVMRDEVGRWITDGVAEGIEGNASSVYKALDSLSNKMRVSTPEVALGTHQMAYTGGNQVSKNAVASTKQVGTNEQEVIIIKPSDVNLEGRPIGEITWEIVHERINQANYGRRKARRK